MATRPKNSIKTLWIILGVLGGLVIAGMIIVACASQTPTPTPAPASTSTSTPAPTTVVIDVNKLYANPWVLVAYGAPENPTVVSKGLVLTLNFTPDSLVNGFGGCNNFSGSAQVASDGAMTVGPLVTTMMACAQGMDQETAYLAALQTARSFDYTNEGRLQIMYGPEGGANQALIFSVGAVPLTGTSWNLVSYGDPANPQPVPSGSGISVMFYDDGSVSGYSGCNQYIATSTLQNNQMTIGSLAITQMSCPTGMDVEQTYLQALTTAQQYSITGPLLKITYNQGAGVLNFTSASLPFENTEWTLISMNGQPLSADTNITALFTPGDPANTGNISGSSGCNTYSTGYTDDNKNLTVQPIASTLMACATGMEAEQAYLQALQATTSYQVLVNNLVLTNPSGNLTFVANRTPLTGALWSLVALGDVKNPLQPVKGSNFTAQFILIPGAPSGVLNGTTGCNEYTAVYAASIDQIKINAPVSSQNSSCVPGLTDQEKNYYLALNNATTYHITGNTMTIPYDNGKQALVFTGTLLEEAKRPALSTLNGTTWFLWYNGNTPILAGTTIYAQFAINSDGTSGTISGSAGCNTYTASFGNGLSVQTTLNALQTCNSPQGIMDQEVSYINVLSRGYGYWQTGDQLIVNTGLGALTYHTAPPPSSADQTHLLVEQTWYLISYDKSYSTAGTQEPYSKFNADGTLTGFTGCNNYSGNYTTNIQGIAITNLNVTQESCPNSILQAQQDAMLGFLGSASSYQVSESVMQIVSGQGVLNYSITPLHRTEEIKPPTAVIIMPSTAPVNSIVAFDAEESSGQVATVAFEWDFGDGIAGTGEKIEHVYAAPNSYTVKLVVTDERGNQGTTTEIITITAAEAPVATPTVVPQPTAQPTATPPPTQPSQPTATDVPTQPSQPTATAVPTQPPQPTATPEPTQPPQPTATTAPTEPPQVPPQASIVGPANGYVGEPVTFDASGSVAGSSPIVSYSWSFGDGTTAGPSAESSQTTLYNQSGNYTVSVAVTDQNGLSSSATTQVTISVRLGTPVVWVLNQLAGQPLLPGSSITLQFQAGQIAGFAGCNSYTGSYTATPNPDGTYTVALTGIVTSGMSCPPDIMDQESKYLSLLSTVTTAIPEGSGLTLSAPDGSLSYHQAGSISISPY